MSIALVCCALYNVSYLLFKQMIWSFYSKSNEIYYILLFYLNEFNKFYNIKRINTLCK
ncbi:hypothetical protein HMPREF9420_1554 [Segatella salivae DSM 15606]|uniref:Uncharacterized protein n=1 Tax=Segatella salivae DSM 15606 TaxID=888832 RepID=E6MPY6_9BACT|nr:hypothetical protein HMPREF9420_1554 [Segatella salivae DSM 15606]